MLHTSPTKFEAKEKKHSLFNWFLACRPKTLSISLAPILVGTALASQKREDLNSLWMICLVVCSLGIQIGTNLVNDALDFKKGADTPDRLGPKRMTQAGLLSFQQVLFAGYLAFGLSLIGGIPLIMIGGWPLGIIICLSIACGYLYTGGPYPLAYIGGMSDFCILVFFGWVSTVTTYYLQTGGVNFECLLAATQIGLLAIVPHAINNLRDHVADARVNKRTLAVRFGQGFVRWEITICSLLPFMLGLFWIQKEAIGMLLLPFLVFIPIVFNLRSLWTIEPHSQYNQFLAKSALHQFLFACLLALGAIWT